MKQLLLRADDLGYSEAINYGMAKTVKEGLINNVGVMVNMPATEHGVNLLKDEKISFGQHTNFSAGYPLSNPQKIPSLVDQKGAFKTSKDYRTAEKDFVVFEEALIEIEAQYQRFLSLFGRKPDYFEGHAVASENFLAALAFFAEKNTLTYSGLPEGMEPNSMSQEAFMYVNQTKVYLTMESMKPHYDPLNMLREKAENPHADGVEMLVFHPGYLDAYIMENSSLLAPRTWEVDMLVSAEAKKIVAETDIQLLEYKNL